jgi:hypothetical protein
VGTRAAEAEDERSESGEPIYPALREPAEEFLAM